MQNSSATRSFLRRHPRLRRAFHRARARLVLLRRDGSGRGFPAAAALLALLVAALLLTALSGGSLAPPPQDPGRSDTTGTPAMTAPSDANRATPSGAAPSGTAPATSPTAAPETPGATWPAASPGASGGSGESESLGEAFGQDCTEGTQGNRELAALRTPEALTSQTARFSTRIDSLAASLSGTSRTFADLALDPAAGTRALILAKNLVCAENLNGYFYFLYDPGAATSGIAPLVLVVDRLFTDEDRERVLADGTYATPEIETALGAALEVLLGPSEGKRASAFALGLYREVFSARVAGEPPSETRRFLALPETTVVFQDAYMTYVEFLPGGAP